MIFNQTVGGGEPKAQLIAWIKKSGQSVAVNTNFSKIYGNGDAISYSGMYFVYAEDSSGSEVFFVPWVYDTASYSDAMENGGDYWVTQNLQLTINPNSSYDFELTNEAQDEPAPLSTLYVFPEVQVTMT